MRQQQITNDCATRWHPPWVCTLGTAVWVTDPAGQISYINSRAEDLIGRPASELIGGPCHEVIAGRTPTGKVFCSAECPVRRIASDEGEISPFHLSFDGSSGKPREVCVVAIAAHRREHEPPHVIHCVVDNGRGTRLSNYIDGVATRSHPLPPSAVPDHFGLTAREKEILNLLARDKTLRDISNELFLSYATVRNHTQHILGKLGVHSILEAVAFYLLNDK